jgi:hypothetical protein
MKIVSNTLEVHILDVGSRVLNVGSRVLDVLKDSLTLTIKRPSQLLAGSNFENYHVALHKIVQTPIEHLRGVAHLKMHRFRVATATTTPTSRIRRTRGQPVLSNIFVTQQKAIPIVPTLLSGASS